jgi:hypothetical protein
MTYPLVLHLDRGVRDPGDPLLNSWILAWNAHKITSLDWKNLFQANIFYPNQRTLAYSEFLFTQSLVALPINLLSGNPILAHNIVLLLAFVTSGFGMYLLASYLTKSRGAGIVAGIIYAFCPFMFAHLSHIQVLSAGGIPLAFLFLHRYFSTESGRDFFLFALFFILQVLANSYYALYLTLFAGLYIGYQMTRRRRYADPRVWLKLGIFVLLVAAVAGPFFYQYLRVRQEMGFSREVGYAAKPINYLATSPINRVYGGLTRFARSPEGELYPGGIAFLLALTALVTGIRPARKKAEDIDNPKVNKRLRTVKLILDGLIVIYLAIILMIIYGQGFHLAFGRWFEIHAHSLLNPLILLAILVTGRVAVTQLFKKKADRIVLQGEEPLYISAVILILAVLFSMGLKGPYYLLYRFFPGFDGLRVASRFQVFAVFSLAVLAAFGWRSIYQKCGRLGKPILTLALPVLLLTEYFSVPIPLSNMPLKAEVPRVYHWLGSSEGKDGAILELPLPMSIQTVCNFDCVRVYFSTFHWRNMVNGFSGYFSPLYTELMRRLQVNPLNQDIQDLKSLRLRYLLIHSAAYAEGEFQSLTQALAGFEKDLHPVLQFDDFYVFEFTPAPEESGDNFKKLPPLSLKGARVRANVGEELAGKAVDGSLETRWQTGPQKKGDQFEVDLGSVQSVKGIALELGRFSEDFPRGYRVEVSTDGVTWQIVAEQENVRLPLLAYLRPRSLPLDILFPVTSARLIKITNTADDPSISWSICEIGLYK